MPQCALAISLLLLLFLRLVGIYFRLRWIPGPWFAGLSDCWRWHIRRSPRYGSRLVDLHEKYGRIVRLGPSCVSVSDATLRSRTDGRLDELSSNENVLSIRGSPGTESSSLDGSDSLLAQDREEYLEDASVYQGTIDHLVSNFFATIKAHRALDLPTLLHYIGMDFLGILTMDEHVEEDAAHRKTPAERYHDGQIHSLFSQSTMQYLMLNNPRARRRRRLCPLRRPRRPECRLTGSEQTMSSGSMFHPTTNTTPYTANFKLQSILISFVSMFYSFFQFPDIMTSVKDEINTAFRDGALSEIPRWSELTRLPYLDAIMKESMRCSPFTAYYHEANAPMGGMEISGIFLPEKTTLVCHPEVLRHSRHIYGSHPDTFDPARWINVGDQQRITMEDNLFAGATSFLGCSKSYAAWMELKKAAVLILRDMDLRPETESADCDV